MKHDIYRYPHQFRLESGEVLPGFHLAYTTYGELNARRDNAVWVCHALTANSEVHAWWEGVVGSERILQPDNQFIVCVNIPGSCYGSLGPLNAYEYHRYDRFPLLSSRDVARMFDLLRQYLGLGRIHLLIGASLGGQHALEWAIERPEVFEHLFVLCTNARHSAWGIAFNEAQRMAIWADSTYSSRQPYGGLAGMRAARATALLSYRNYTSYQHFQSDSQGDKLEDFKSVSYQQYQGDKLAARFNAYSYVALSRMMDSHNLGRGRESVEKALSKIRAKTLVLGITSDILFPVDEQRFLALFIPRASYREIDSIYGHDGFLIETDAINHLFRGWYGEYPSETVLTQAPVALEFGR